MSDDNATQAHALDSMFTMQRQLQRDSFGYDIDRMTEAERVEYIKWNVLALTDELHEMLAETSWKPWAKNVGINDDKAFNEMIDAWHFMMNIMMAIMPNFSPDQLTVELRKRYERKHEVNITRQETGYDGVTTKCRGCMRALDDPNMIHDLGNDDFECASCGYPIPSNIAKTVDSIQSGL